MGKRRVVITGIGIVSPLGNTTAESWGNVLEGKSGINEVTRFDASAFSARIAGEVRGFDIGAYLPPKEVKKHDLFSQFSIAAAEQAWNDSGIAKAGYDPVRVGSILGIGIGGISTLEKYYAAYLSGGPRKISPFLIPAMISNLGPGNIAIRFGLKGINFTITSACTSGTHAIGESARMIAEGVQDAIITGGAESAITPTGLGGFCAMKALSTRNDEPDKASRPFDKDRDGFVLGEGAAVLVLEPLERAEARGAPIYAEVLGYGYSCDAYHITAPCPDGEGAVICMKQALESAGLKPEEVQYVNAHGTSTEANDVTETLAIKKVFGDWAKSGLVVSSTKSMTGHLLGAAGAIEAAFTALAIRDSVVPPTINLDNPDPECDLDYVPNEKRPLEINAAMSNSFGFGGTNGSVVLARVDR
ncbi:MAG: beta-ketoacyl-[acyl-carrier-protein] synthase II [Candidatus Dadabacteria bacterium]|nr:MAG: beta-ketoacyl-[acyl-carrier-protein] synthase II [Candidatus Dadabacteria bacterium]